MPFRGIIPGKSKLSVDYPSERHVIRELFCVKTGFSTVKSAESKNFPRISCGNACHPRIILRRGRFFHGKFHGKSKLSANFPAVSFNRGKYF
jgi:hypothetical protein